MVDLLRKSAIKLCYEDKILRLILRIAICLDTMTIPQSPSVPAPFTQGSLKTDKS